MPELEYFLVAESVSIDQATNRTSIFNVLEEISTPGFPGIIQNCVAVSLWRLDKQDRGKDWQVILKIKLPDNTGHAISSNFKSTGLRHRISQHIQGLPLPQTGNIVFEIHLNGEYVAKHILTIGELDSSAHLKQVPPSPLPEDD